MQNQPSFGFGATPTTQASTGGFQFGTPATSTTGLFGSQTGTLKPTGFGTPTAQPLKTGFGLPPATSAPATGSLLFPSAAPTAQPPAAFGGGLFGTTATPATSTTTPSLFGQATAVPSQTPGGPLPSFGSAVSTVKPTLGLSTASTAAPTVGGLTFGVPTSVTTTASLSFGLGTATTTNAPPSFGLGGTTTSAPSLSFGLGGTAASTAPSTSLTSTTAPPVVGLGGVAPAQTVVSKQKDVSPKEQTLPNEIVQTVDAFKEMVKKQKVYSTDISRCSVRDFRKVEADIGHMLKLLTEVENQLQKNRHFAEKMKYDTAKCLQTVEMAQATQDTPPGLQYENVAPLKFFLDLAEKFENDMHALKLQIESADNYIKNYRNPSVISSQDVSLGIRKLHETFVALAGRLHSIHNQVESQKESYLNLRKQVCNDFYNPFEKLYTPQELSMNNLKSALIYSPPKVATGPTPFSNLNMGNTSIMLLQQSQNPPTFQGPTATPQAGFGSGMSFGSSLGGPQTPSASLFGTSSFGQSSNNFQLQKPPSGHKRSK
nr:probable nucleoporin Nup58 [Leptinotarsa decemlineata]